VELGFAKRTLGNGLDVIVHEDRGLPIVAVNLWYHVGSKNERPGRTGFAHLFEHLMFEGSLHHDRGFFPPLQEAGAALNGSTNGDRTNYWEVVPTGALDLALWLESDRMGWLLPALTREKFDTQREVVLNERRQSYENRPYGLASIALHAALFPPGHPYQWPTIGLPDDLRAATLEDVQAFFSAYYHPANASLALAGDLDADEGFALAERYFGEIPPGPAVEPLAVPRPALGAERRLVLEDRVEFPRLYLAWHSPALFEAGDAELDLAADLIGGGKTSRLYRTLVVDSRLALDVSAHQSSRERGGIFQVAATAAAGRTLGDLDAAISEEIGRLATTGPTGGEMERVSAQVDAHFVARLQTVGGFNGKSDQLNAYNTFLGDPGYFPRDLERYRRATAGAIGAQVAATLGRAHRVALSVVPRGRPDLALAGSAPAVAS
jgi:zinc protease